MTQRKGAYEGPCVCVRLLLQLGDVMVDISSNLMLADERVLWMAQREARACSRIVECLQRIASHRLAGGAQAYSTVSPPTRLLHAHTGTRTHGHAHTGTHAHTHCSPVHQRTRIHQPNAQASALVMKKRFNSTRHQFTHGAH